MTACSLLARTALTAAALAAFVTAPAVRADYYDIELTGFEEVPVVATSGRAFATLWDDRGVAVELEWDLEGVITQAHIHFGKPNTNGGVVAWICANPRVGSLSLHRPGLPCVAARAES